MESLLWALDLLVLLFVCRWALRADVAETAAEEQRKKSGQG
ncbi:hypothetical protein [Massilia niabensis]|uniref:Uncharacterized protein n=1 Tax=Massilia niabensis TaxID=544910 RepID=A0ABW0L3B9_9BURK